MAYVSDSVGSSPKPVGYVKVLLYVGLPDEEPVEVGTLSVPFTIRHINGQHTIEGQLREAIEYTAAKIEQVFDHGPKDEGTPK